MKRNLVILLILLSFQGLSAQCLDLACWEETFVREHGIEWVSKVGVGDQDCESNWKLSFDVHGRLLESIWYSDSCAYRWNQFERDAEGRISWHLDRWVHPDGQVDTLLIRKLRYVDALHYVATVDRVSHRPERDTVQKEGDHFPRYGLPSLVPSAGKTEFDSLGRLVSLKVQTVDYYRSGCEIIDKGISTEFFYRYEGDRLVQEIRNINGATVWIIDYVYREDGLPASEQWTLRDSRTQEVMEKREFWYGYGFY